MAIPKRAKLLVATAAAAVLVGGAAVAFAGQGGSNPPAARRHNSAGCVPRGNGEDVTAPDACGPGNYPVSQFYKTPDGKISLACSDAAAEAPTAAAGPGEPDPQCHPMSRADMEQVDKAARDANQHPVNPPAPVPGP